jgi:hypothetical protein
MPDSQSLVQNHDAFLLMHALLFVPGESVRCKGEKASFGDTTFGLADDEGKMK